MRILLGSPGSRPCTAKLMSSAFSSGCVGQGLVVCAIRQVEDDKTEFGCEDKGSPVRPRQCEYLATDLKGNDFFPLPGNITRSGDPQDCGYGTGPDSDVRGRASSSWDICS